MKKIIFTLLTCWMAGQLLAADAQWLTSVPEATAQAKKENKLVLLDFTGSDWCGWCKKLDAETFSKSEFTDYARKNLVLVEVDFPAQKQQSAELKAANKALQEKYQCERLPHFGRVETGRNSRLEPGGIPGWRPCGHDRQAR